MSVEPILRTSGETGAPSDDELQLMDRYWRAVNYLSVGQIYLMDNPLLREALRPEHVKPRLLGPWGTTPTLNFIYVYMNRVIRKPDRGRSWLRKRQQELLARTT